jgi:hypothetical protein
VVAAVSHPLGNVARSKREMVEFHEDGSFGNSVKNIFNDKKNSIVRVVCVAKVEEGTRVDVSNAKQILSGTGFLFPTKHTY